MIKAHSWEGIDYWRVYRAWGGKEYQRYIRWGKDKDAALEEAKKIDENLAQRQRAYFYRQALDVGYHIDDNGLIRGVRRQIVKRSERPSQDVIRLRVKVPWEERIRHNTVSVDHHGVRRAHELAIDKYCEWYGFDERSEIRKALLGTYDAYLNIDNVKNAAPRESESDLDIDQLQQDIERFNKQRKKKVISGR